MNVVLLVIDEDGVEMEWHYYTGYDGDDALTAIDMALEMCEYKIVGIQRVESHSMDES